MVARVRGKISRILPDVRAEATAILAKHPKDAITRRGNGARRRSLFPLPAPAGGRSGRSQSFKWHRIFSITAPSPIRLIIFSGPEQRGQTSGSAS